MDHGTGMLEKAIAESARIVFFGGAGISTESGIPDFRSEDGLYNAKKNFGAPPEELLSEWFFREKPDVFYRYYRENLVHTEALPNAAHTALAKLEAAGKLSAVVTQNIDGLHQGAGSKNVLELHGSIMRNHCLRCGKKFALDYVMDKGNDVDGVPSCDSCGGTVRPDVVLYGETLDEETVEAAVDEISKADMLIVGGTSLVVYPAAGMVRYFSGKVLALINKSPTGTTGGRI
jgi:NAD-dependent deacetylase